MSDFYNIILNKNSKDNKKTSDKIKSSKKSKKDIDNIIKVKKKKLKIYAKILKPQKEDNLNNNN
jgi:hypothetical protein